MKEFFENLKEIRENKGFTLEDISRQSRLPVHILKEIEAGNLENLPTGYDRIFFKRYLKEIGEDRSEVWRDFNLFFGKGPSQDSPAYSSDFPTEPEQQVFEPENELKAAPAEEKSSAWQEFSFKTNLDKLHGYFWLAITLIVLGVVGYFAWQQFMFVKNNPLEVREITPTEMIREMQLQDSAMTPAMARDTVIRGDKPGQLVVELNALHRTWIREIRDNTDTTDYIMPPGLKREIEAQESVQLLLGRADGVEIHLNDKNLGIMGSGEQIVTRLVLTPRGIADKRMKIADNPTPVPGDTNGTVPDTTALPSEGISAAGEGGNL
ncbi:MAG: RodZ domain-containing protein [Calditrichia bacterium]